MKKNILIFFAATIAVVSSSLACGTATCPGGDSFCCEIVVERGEWTITNTYYQNCNEL